jgi:hypothetical protein
MFTSLSLQPDSDKRAEEMFENKFDDSLRMIERREF